MAIFISMCSPFQLFTKMQIINVLMISFVLILSATSTGHVVSPPEFLAHQFASTLSLDLKDVNQVLMKYQMQL